MKRKWIAGLAVLLMLCTGCGSEVASVGKLDPEEIMSSLQASLDAEEAKASLERQLAEEAASKEKAEAEAAAAAEEEPEEPEETRITITISAAGDCTLGNYEGQGYAGTFAQKWDEVQEPGYFLENVKPVFENDDCTIVNLEGPLTNAAKHKEKTYSISGSPDYVQVLTEGSVEAVTLANNHHLDCFEEGNLETIQTVEDAGIVYTQEYKVGVFETKGIQIGLVSADVISLGSGAEKVLMKGIEELQTIGADIIIANCHWGIEREYYPNAYQKKLGHMLIDAGCDLVLGHHPHVMQGIEEYNGKYIVYSLGNFCFGANKNPADKDCYIFQQTFVFEEGERSEETQAGIVPCTISSQTSVNDYKPTPAEGDKIAKILDRMTQYSKDLGVAFDEEGWIIRQ